MKAKVRCTKKVPEQFWCMCGYVPKRCSGAYEVRKTASFTLRDKKYLWMKMRSI